MEEAHAWDMMDLELQDLEFSLPQPFHTRSNYKMGREKSGECSEPNNLGIIQICQSI